MNPVATKIPALRPQSSAFRPSALPPSALRPQSSVFRPPPSAALPFPAGEEAAGEDLAVGLDREADFAGVDAAREIEVVQGFA